MLEPRDELPAGVHLRLRPTEVLGILLFWGFLATLTTTGRLLDPRIPELRPDIGSATISLAFIEYSLWAALTFPIVGLVNWSSERPQHRKSLRVVLALAGVAVAIAVNVVLWLARSQLLRPPPGGRPQWFGGLFRGEFVGDLILYAAVVGAALARNYFLISQSRLDETRGLQAHAAQLQARLAEAQLDALRTQLNPHFLFNTLNAISTLVERDPRGVRRMIARLSELLRHTLEQTDEQEITLDRELELLQRYLDIMDVRFGDRLEVAVHVDDDVRVTLVPNLILQPLVENALKHGVDAIQGVGRVEIAGRRDGSDVVLTVSDNGPGPMEKEPSADGGVGLRNTIARLEQLYGNRQRFVLRAGNDGGTIAQVRLPFHTQLAAE